MIKAKSDKRKAAQRMKWVRLIHSFSAMFMLLSTLFFAVTGITLNHTDWFKADSRLNEQTYELHDALFRPETLEEIAAIEQGAKTLSWLKFAHGIQGGRSSFEWDGEENLLMIDVKRPGGYSYIEVDVAARSVLVEETTLGAIALINDLHKGRNASEFWLWFIDINAVVMLVFSLTGLWMVLPMKKRRGQLFSVGLLGCVAMLGFYWMAI